MCKRILALLCLICSSASWAIQENKTVRFAIGDWEPYTSRQDNPEFKVAETIVRAAFANQGYQVELDYFPWSRAYKYAESGAYDGSFPWMMTPERQTIFLYSKPFFTQHIVFFYHKSSQFDWHSVEDLKSIVSARLRTTPPPLCCKNWGLHQILITKMAAASSNWVSSAWIPILRG